MTKKLSLTTLILSLPLALSFAQTFPVVSTGNIDGFGAPLHQSGQLQLSEEQLNQVAAPSTSIQQNAPLALLSAPMAATSSSVNSNFAADFTSYPTDIQNIVRACNGDVHKIFDLIRNNVEFQPYFGFRKSPEFTWQSRRGNDADQAFLLVKCLRAAGFDADFEYGFIIMSDTDTMDWFGADNITGLSQMAGSAGYFAGSGIDIYGIEQIWCTVLIDGTRHKLAPAYKTYETVAGIDLDAALNYSESGLLTAAGGTETSTYVQNISESGVATYLQNRAMDLVTELQSNHPTAELDEIISGRRIAEAELASDYSDGFYTADVFISDIYDNFIFDDPYVEHIENSNSYSFYATLSLAVGEVGSSGTAFVGDPFIVHTAPTGTYSGKKISISFDTANQNAAQLQIDDQVVGSESGTPTANDIGIGYTIEHPYDRGAGSQYDQTRIREIDRSGVYVYSYDAGGVGATVLSTRRRKILENYKRDGLIASDPEVLSETLYLLGLDWLRQYDLAGQLIAKHRGFVPILHHTMALSKQEAGFSVDIPSAQVNVDKSGSASAAPLNTRALLIFGSAMEHGVIEQNYPNYNAVSTVRYVRENNLAGGKTYLATSANYSSIETDPDFIAGWDSFFRTAQFPADLSAGVDLIIPEDGAIVMDSLTGNGYYRFASNFIGAVINPGALKGGFTTESGDIDLTQNPNPNDPTPGQELLPNPLSYEPIDMLTGAYVYDGTDLTISGAGVRGLAFTRHYSSLASANDRGMGKGWSHNHQSSIVEHSDIEAALGQSTPVHAAALIAATRAVSDLVDSPSSPKAWVVGSIAAWWGVDQIQDNTATIEMGRRTLPFTKLADGSFLPPAGMTGTLTQDGVSGEYSLEERFDVVADFNAENQLASITDADGKQLTYAYYTSGADAGKLQTVTDAYGRTLTYTYTSGLLTKVADSTGRDMDFAYTGDLLTGVTDPENHTSNYAYDSDDRIETVFNKKGEIIAHNTYDEFGQVSIQVAEDDADQEWNYAFTGTRNVEINADAEFLSYVFDDKGRTIVRINGEGDKTSFDYDGQNQLVKLIDPRGNITRMEYDGANNLRFVYDARNGASGTTYKTERQYDSEFRLSKLIDEAGNETGFDYDTEHHLKKITDPLLREISFTYIDSGLHDGLVETITTPGATAGQTDSLTIAYDANGYPNSITREDDSVLTETFNARGDLLFSEITTTGETNTYPVTNTYDLNRRLLTSTNDLGFGVTREIDEVGRVVEATDLFGNTSSATYSPLSRAETVTVSNDETSTVGFDNSGRRTSVTNALNQTSNLAYDQAGRLASASNPLSQSITQDYDAAGNRTVLTNARNKSYQFTYTANDLLESLTTPLNRVFNYAYDDRLQLKTVEEPSTQTTTLHYYEDGLLEQLVDPLGTVDFAYDAKGRLKTVTEGAQVITRSHDELNRVTSFTDSQSNTIGYAYDGGNNLTTLTYPASKGSVIYEYDNASRLVKITDWANRETEFIYDGNSRLSEMRLPNGTKRTYGYDAAGRVERMTDTHTASSTVLLDQQFEFDALNRIVEEAVSPEPALYTINPAIMTYDDDDRITSWQSGSTTINPVFDLDGNMTAGPLAAASTGFVYDSRNRLTQVGTDTYAYDAEDRRISKTEGGVSTSYVHDPHARLSRMLQKTTGGTTTFYVYVGDQLLYEETAGQITVYHFDHRGSTLVLSDGAGAVVNRITYGPYGGIVASTSAPTTPFLYNGAYGVQTDGNGLLHMRARYYSTELRRFINADPIGFNGGMNWFAYAEGNPVVYLDPSGFTPEVGGSGDLYRSDPLGHGQKADGTPVDPHVDRIKKNGQKFRYNADGSPRANAPSVPAKDMNAFQRELAKLRRTVSRLGPRAGGGAQIRGGGLAVAMELEFHIKESIKAGRIKVPLVDWILDIEDDSVVAPVDNQDGVEVSSGK